MNIWRFFHNLSTEYLQKKLDSGLDPNYVINEVDNYTILMQAVQGSDTEAVHILLEAGADITLVDQSTGYTVLHYALYGGTLETFERLMQEPGIEKLFEIKDDFHQTAIHHAILRGDTSQFTQLLLDRGVNTETLSIIGFSIFETCEQTGGKGCEPILNLVKQEKNNPSSYTS